MPDFAEVRNEKTVRVCRDGGDFVVGTNGPPGEADRVLLGVEDLQQGDTLRREFTADEAETIAAYILDIVKHIREGM